MIRDLEAEDWNAEWITVPPTPRKHSFGMLTKSSRMSYLTSCKDGRQTPQAAEI